MSDADSGCGPPRTSGWDLRRQRHHVVTRLSARDLLPLGSNENKSLWQRAYDATIGLIKKIIAFKVWMRASRAANKVLVMSKRHMGFHDCYGRLIALFDQRRCHVTYRHDATCQLGGCCVCASTRLNYSIDPSRSSACSIKCSACSSLISRPWKDAFSRIVIIFRAISFRRLVRSTILSSSAA